MACGGTTERRNANADLIVAAVNAVPGHLDEIARLTRERDEAREQRSDYYQRLTASERLQHATKVNADNWLSKWKHWEPRAEAAEQFLLLA